MIRVLAEFALVLLALVAMPHKQPDTTVDVPGLHVQACGMTRGGWSYETLTPSVTDGDGTRRNNWHSDPGQSDEWRAKDKDYVNAEFDRGHHAPADDFGSQKSIDATFVYSNASPQRAEVNRGVWKAIENIVRENVHKGVTVYVATGGIFVPDEKGVIAISVIGPDRVWVPVAHAKAVLIDRGEKTERNQRFSAMAWEVPNLIGVSSDPDDHRVSIDKIEFDSGQDLFRGKMPDDIEKKIEAQK